MFAMTRASDDFQQRGNRTQQVTLTQPSHDRSLSFGSAAVAYDIKRRHPSYPPETIDWLCRQERARFPTWVQTPAN